jgi:hypothetical protein
MRQHLNFIKYETLSMYKSKYLDFFSNLFGIILSKKSNDPQMILSDTCTKPFLIRLEDTIHADNYNWYFSYQNEAI